MRKLLLGAVVGALMAPVALTAGGVHAVNIGNEGCTPGYWKNHTDNWYDNETFLIPSTKKLTELNPWAFAPSATLANDTVLQALNYGGGPGALGAEKILLRAAAAAWLNAAHEGLGYPYRRMDFVPEVNAAIASGDRATMLALAEWLDAANNLGCPLN